MSFDNNKDYDEDCNKRVVVVNDDYDNNSDSNNPPPPPAPPLPDNFVLPSTNVHY